MRTLVWQSQAPSDIGMCPVDFFTLDKMGNSVYDTDGTVDTDNTEERGSGVSKYFSGKRDVYLEIAQRYAEFIRLGVLQEGDKLPSVRVAAGDLGVNPNTVQRAYTYLEEQGLIRMLPKKGAYVTGVTKENNAANSDILEVISRLKDSGVQKQAILQAVKEVYADD